MNKINQNSNEWHEWRRKGIGASDAPIIMGISPYLTLYQLWSQKMGLSEGMKENFVTQLGHKFEEPALNHFILETGIEMTPECVEHKEYPFLRASLDGCNVEKEAFCEIKYMGQTNFDLVKNSKQPLAHHFPQLQHQFMVTGFNNGFYVCYTLNGSKSDIADVFILPIEIDYGYIENKLIEKEMAFWESVQTGTPPPFEKKDVLNESDIANISMARRWKSLKLKINQLEEEIEQIETHLKKLNNTHPMVRCGDVLVSQVVRRGNVNYSQIPELLNVDLEKYRKPPSIYSQIKEVKNAGIEKDSGRDGINASSVCEEV